MDSLRGQARAIHTDADQPVSLHEGDEVLLGDIILTAKSARIRLRFRDDTVVNLGEEATMRVTKYVFTREQSRLAALLTVASGYFRVITGKIFEISGMTIRTMTATGSIRGTDWMGVASDESTQIFVSSGEVVVRSLYLKEQGEVVLRAGEGTVINQNNAPAAKKRWPQSKVNQFLTSTDVN